MFLCCLCIYVLLPYVPACNSGTLAVASRAIGYSSFERQCDRARAASFLQHASTCACRDWDV